MCHSQKCISKLGMVIIPLVGIDVQKDFYFGMDDSELYVFFCHGTYAMVKVPSGKNYGQSLFFSGKIHYRWQFPIAMLNFQRVHGLFDDKRFENGL